jgi:hypothetical protein
VHLSQPQRRARRGIVFEVRAGGTPKYSGIVTKCSYLPGPEKCKIRAALAWHESTAPILSQSPPAPREGRGHLFSSKKKSRLHSKPEERSPDLTTPSPIDEVEATYFYTHRCQSVERECACCCEFFSLWCSGHKRTIKNQGRALGEWVRELGPDLPVTRYCLLGGVARGVALDIFTMNGSLSVDVKRLALRILLDCCDEATCPPGVIDAGRLLEDHRCAREAER